MSNSLSDRQVLMAIVLTIFLIISLVIFNLRSGQDREPGLLWRDKSDQPLAFLAA
ncbi:hypothetical protein [Synechococcus sp. M16CYN]|uniref:hypothetical protein n=1 Tax=Synechococcus sp. M16CYN TaxID=3103139 RepID=UPI0033407BD6